MIPEIQGYKLYSLKKDLRSFITRISSYWFRNLIMALEMNKPFLMFFAFAYLTYDTSM